MIRTFGFPTRFGVSGNVFLVLHQLLPVIKGRRTFE